jgi:ribosome-binding factor A
VKMTPDLTLAKVYLSVFNTENKQVPILEIRENQSRIRQAMGNKMKSRMRRIPEFAFYLDETIDEMYRVDELFQRLHADNQMGAPEETTED